MRKLQTLSVSIAALMGLGFVIAVDADELKGRVKSVSSVARTIAVELENKSVVVVKFDGSTQFKNAASSSDFIPDEVVAVDYSPVGTENRAKLISKVIALPPPGVTRISAAALRELAVREGQTELQRSAAIAVIADEVQRSAPPLPPAAGEVQALPLHALCGRALATSSMMARARAVEFSCTLSEPEVPVVEAAGCIEQALSSMLCEAAA